MRMLSSMIAASILVSGAALAADGPARPKAPHGAKVMIVSPEDGATVGVDRERDLERGFTITDSGITVVGKGIRIAR